MDDIQNNNECLACVVYLYDYLSGNKDDVPKSMIKHIDNCDICQEEIKLLRQEIERADNLAHQADNQARLANLELHFAYIDKPVTCNNVKPFLAAMSSGFLGISISTPITAHIDNCSACRNDIDTIKDLQMTDMQLFRAGQLLAISASETLDRQEISQNLVSLECDQLQIDKISEVIMRPESAVKTMFSLTDPAPNNAGQSNALKEAQVEIQLLQSEAQAESDAGKTKSSRSSLLQFVRPLAAAAAVIIVAFLIFNGPQATGFTDIAKAVKNARNIYMKNIDAATGQTAQQVWTSKDFNIKLFKTDDKVFLWDIDNEKTISKSANDGQLITANINERSLAMVTESMNISWTIIPFETNNLPDGAAWRAVSDKELVNVSTDIKVYDILWTQRTQTGTLIYKKWRGFLNQNTMLPERIEFSTKYDLRKDFELETIVEVTYPDKNEMKKAIDEFSLLESY